MAKTVKLKHTVHTADKMFYFYEGEAEVKEGVVTIPADRPEWIRRAWVMGYRLDPKTGENLELSDILPST